MNKSIRDAESVEAMITQKPWCDQIWARAALAIAARAIRRGRHLTKAERLENLAMAMEEDGSEEGQRVAAKLRSTQAGLT